jgi:MSHA biogenesis protein MshI
MAVEIEAGAIKFVHIVRPANARPSVLDSGYVECAIDQRAAVLNKLAKDKGLNSGDCFTLLDPSEYQLLLVDAPNVPREELKAAIRWKIKDLIEYHINDATVDVIEIPSPPDSSVKVSSMYAVVAANEVVQKKIALFDSADLPLRVIDIPEMAQRNLASLFEQPGRAVAFLAFSSWGGLLTFSFEGDLVLARRLEVTSDQLSQQENQAYYRERVSAEISRSLDHFERQFTGMAVGELLLAPFPARAGFDEYLRANIFVPVRAIDLTDVIDFPADAVPDAMSQWRVLYAIGAALRFEEKKL